jgi:hypothetical protein
MLYRTSNIYKCYIYNFKMQEVKREREVKIVCKHSVTPCSTHHHHTHFPSASSHATVATQVSQQSCHILLSVFVLNYFNHDVFQEVMQKLCHKCMYFWGSQCFDSFDLNIFSLIKSLNKLATWK